MIIVYHSPQNRVVHRMGKGGSGWPLVVFWSFFLRGVWNGLL